MDDHRLFKDDTLQGLLDKLDMIECVNLPGKRLRVAEVWEKHEAIYQAMNVAPPISL